MRKILFTFFFIALSVSCEAVILYGDVIHSDSASYNNEEALDSAEIMRKLEVMNIRVQALDAFTKGYMDKAINYYKQLSEMDQLEDIDKWWFMGAYGLMGAYKESIQVFESIDDYDNLGEKKRDVFNLAASCYFFLHDFDRTIYYRNLANMYFEDEPLVQASNYRSIAACYSQKKCPSLALSWVNKAMQTYADNYKVDVDYLIKDCKNKLKPQQQSFRSEELDEIIFWYYTYRYQIGLCDTQAYLKDIKALAKAGNINAKQIKNKLPKSAFWSIW